MQLRDDLKRRFREAAMERFGFRRGASPVVTKEGKSYVAATPELDITSPGKSFEAALERLGEAIELYVEAKIPETSQLNV